MRLCEKGIAKALSILRDADAPYWDKAEAESFLRSEMVLPTLSVKGKVIGWTVEYVNGFTLTNAPERVFTEWLHTALAEA